MKKTFSYQLILQICCITLNAADSQPIKMPPSYDEKNSSYLANKTAPIYSFASFVDRNGKKIETQFPSIKTLEQMMPILYPHKRISEISDSVLQESLRKEPELILKICKDLYKYLQQEFFSSNEYWKIKNHKSLSAIEKKKLHLKIKYMIEDCFILLTKIFSRNHIINKGRSLEENQQCESCINSFNSAFFDELIITEYIKPENKVHLFPERLEKETHLLGYIKFDTNTFSPFLINTKKNLSFYQINANTTILGHNQKLLESSGFLVSEQRTFSTIDQSNDAFEIMFIQNYKSTDPCHSIKILKDLFIPDSNIHFWEMIDIKDQDDVGSRYGFFALPTSKEEVALAALDLIELFETMLEQTGLVTKDTLTYLEERLTSQFTILFKADEQFSHSLTCLEPLALTYDDQPQSSSSSSNGSNSSSEQFSLQIKLQKKISTIKEYCKERILSEYEKTIITEQELRKEGVIKGATKSTRNSTKGKGKTKAKGKGKQKQKQEEKIKSESKRATALKLLAEHQAKSKIKLRHMMQIMNALLKEHKVEIEKVRINGSHCNFDFGKGTQSCSFAKPHGKKEGISIGVANDFFNSMLNMIGNLDETTRDKMANSPL